MSDNDTVRAEAIRRATEAHFPNDETVPKHEVVGSVLDHSGLLEENQRLRELLNTGGRVRIKKGKDKLFYGTKIAVNGEPTWTTEGLHNLAHVKALAENDWPGVEVVVENGE